MQCQTLCIDQDVPLLAFDLLARVVSVRIDVGTALFRALDALGIDYLRGRTGLPRGCLPECDVERMVDALQRSIPAPAIEVVILRAACRHILGDGAPLTAGAEDVHQTRHHLAEVDP